MAVFGTLHAVPDSLQTNKILIAAAFAGRELKTVVPKDLECGMTCCPLNKLPCFESARGQVLCDANAIACFVSDALVGKTSDEQAELLQWIGIADNDFVPHVLAWVLPSLSAMAFNKTTVEKAKHDLFDKLAALNKYLLAQTFLVRERFSVADIILACDLLPAYQYVLDAEARSQFKCVQRWLDTVVHQSCFTKVLGEVAYCSKPASFDGKKFKEFQEALGIKGGEKPKKEKHGGEGDHGKKKEEKKETEKKPKEEHNEEPESFEPKEKDPFAGLPKSSFDLDAFKRVYSNEDTLTKAIPYFWEHFDPANYSIWFSEYKYPDELAKIYMSCNLITGMYQRLEKLRKNAFASVCVFGEDDNSTISGIWVWRGHELVFKLSENWQIDYESYDWKKLDPDAAETKDLMREYLTWEGTFGGKKFNQGKIFK